jgi:outer membrane protein TolC
MEMAQKVQGVCLGAGTFALLFLFVSVNGGLISNAYGQTIKSGDVLLTLKDAIEIALENQPTIEAQQGQVAASEARVGQARGDFYPRLSLGTAYTHISPVSTRTGETASNAGLPPGSPNIPTGPSGSYEQYAASGSISLLIFDFGKVWAQVKAQKLSSEAARHDLQATRDQVIEGVKEAYYSLLSVELSKKVTAEKVQQFKKHLEYARDLYSVGSKSKLDVTKAEVDLSNAQVDMIKVKNGVRYFRLSLNNAMGLPQAPAYTVEEDRSSDIPNLSFEAALETAYSSRAELLSLQKQKESTEQSLKAAQRSHFPVLSGNANYLFVNTEFPLDRGWTAGVTMSVPVFSGLTTYYKIAEYRANLKTINARIKELKQKIAVELEQGFLALRESDERRRSTEVAVKQAKENMDLANERYAAGLAISVEVSDAIFKHTNVQFSNISAHYDNKIALARIERAMGSPLAATAP